MPRPFNRLARKFSPYSGNPVHTHLEGYDDVVRFIREADDRGAVIGEFLHMDMPWMEKPPGITKLYSEEIPPFGGDTFFASLSAAYEGLSDKMKALIHDLVGVHTGKGLFALNAAHKSLGVRDRVKESLEAIEVEHPLVCRHPANNRQHLFLSTVLCRFAGMTEAESKSIIDFHMSHASRAEYSCRLRWQPGTLAMWSNQCLLHATINDYSGDQSVVL
ncbi:MAG: TauD/TfdA family dioxygenase [Verrucomicrobiota bacterium]|nr:TauD/TfdA family dioxygenase [Verrucomicrobiota bacterium]